MAMRWRWAMPLVLAGCGAPADRGDPPASPTATPTIAAAAPPAPVSTAAPTDVRSCAAELGAAAAARRVATCRAVSPATHPPCNAANSCALIDDEIARSCALFADGAPMTGCTVDPRSGAAAADVVRRYYAAIDARDYATAWSQWGEDGRPGQSFAAFQRGFARTRATRVAIGPLAPAEGGAGSTYQTVPVTVDATLVDGTRQRFTGDYVVRRVSDVDGASAAQRRWHLDGAHLSPAPG